MILVAYLLALAAWLAGSFAWGAKAPGELFLTAMALHVLVGWRLLAWGRRDLGAGYKASWFFATVGLVFPVSAPPTICLVAIGVVRRAALRRGIEEPLARDLLAASRFWWGTAVAAAILAALWIWAAVVTLADLGGTQGFHPWQDPLATFQVISAVALRFSLVGLTIWYGALLWRTFVLLARDREDAPPYAGSPGEEVAAADTIY